MNIILLIVDALRPDHLSINGYGRQTSPNIDKLAREGIRFPNAYSVLPRSDPAIASILAGLYPHNHGIRLITNKRMLDNVSTMTEILKSHGYSTAFIRSGGIPRDGTDKGFDQYDALSWKIKNKIKRNWFNLINANTFMGVAQQRIETAMTWLNNNKNRTFFLMIHTNDLHWPYPIPPPFDHKFDPDYKGKHDFDTLSSRKYTRGEVIFGNVALPQDEISHAIAHYDGGISYIDAQIQKLVGFMKSNGIYDDTLVLIMSDHGEHFGDHNFYFQHGSSIYESSIKATLILHNTKVIPKGKVINSRIQILDIMPTLLEILNIPLVENIDGVSLMPIISGNKNKVREDVFAETAEEHIPGNKRVYFKGTKGKWRTLINNDWKIIYIPHPENDIFELYNLKQDPEEKNNLINTEKKTAEDMKAKILGFMKAQVNEGDVDIEDLSEKSRKLLVKAGYLEE